MLAPEETTDRVTGSASRVDRFSDLLFSLSVAATLGSGPMRPDSQRLVGATVYVAAFTALLPLSLAF